MTPTFTSLHNQVHLLSDGVVEINTPFTGNLLSVQISTRPDIPVGAPLGYIYQYFQDEISSYAVSSENDCIVLDLPQSDVLAFIPTSYLLSSYNLRLAYTTVGSVIDGSNTTPLPELITGLPSRVSSLESLSVDHSGRLDTIESDLEGMVTPNWDNLSGKPTVFPPSNHTHVINDVINLSSSLDTIGTRLTSLEASTNSNSGLSTFILLTSNTQLESNKSYYATTNNLVCTLPASPTIGDYVELVNGNFSSFRVNHGNSSQSILNNATQSTIGAGSGIILKPYGYIELIFVGSNLWVSTNKYRTVNNWLIEEVQLESTSTQKSYTPTTRQPATDYYDPSYPLSLINNGNNQIGCIKLNGNPFSPLAFICTFSSNTVLDSFRAFGGQWNGYFNVPETVEIYSGIEVNQLNRIYSGNFAHNTQVQVSSIPTAQTQYLFCFYLPNPPAISLAELQVFGRSSSFQGGEISVI